MRKAEKQEFINKKSIAYYSGFGGLEVKEVLYGVNDAVVFVVGAWTGSPEVHTARIIYGGEYDYFNYKGVRISFRDLLSM